MCYYKDKLNSLLHTTQTQTTMANTNNSYTFNHFFNRLAWLNERGMSSANDLDCITTSLMLDAFTDAELKHMGQAQARKLSEWNWAVVEELGLKDYIVKGADVSDSDPTGDGEPKVWLLTNTQAYQAKLFLTPLVLEFAATRSYVN
jgi:hypothetical protein